MIRRFLLPSAAVLSLAVLAAGPAFAVPVSCPGTASSNDREITLDTTPAATCVAYGQGNFGSSDANTHLGAGLWTLIDKSDDGNSYYGSNGEALQR